MADTFNGEVIYWIMCSDCGERFAVTEKSYQNALKLVCPFCKSGDIDLD